MIMPPYMTNDRFIWTADEPDAELIEPEILASVDKNWLTFTLQEDCPPQSHCFTLYNYGDHAFAFHISTSDNYAYFVSQISSFQVNGMVFGRQLHALPFHSVQNANGFLFLLIRCSPRKDRLFIYLAPIFHWKTQPTSVFNHTMPYETLKICLNYTAQSMSEGLNFSLQERRRGWNTWQSFFQKPQE
ncbi:unnamed protein product [Onchocerca ochengi]|uniref:Major sperm protein n=1 Tax=Onchocerca ochengi TaxID=42157 RepID=A0A182EPJ2_ONCOC|nr:unnamed protein product [Onchocerca ochengi]